MPEDYDTEIREAEKQLEATTARMEEIRQEFLQATIEFIEPWYWQQTESTVKHKPEITKELGVERLSQLKADIQALQAEASGIVAEFLQDDRLWWHRKQGQQSYYYHGNRPPEQLDKVIRLIAGKLAPILEEYGYLPTSLQDREVWREWDQSGNHHPPNARPYYTSGLDWSERMKTLINEYQDLHRKAPVQAQKAEMLRQAKAQSEAEELWKQA